MFMADKTYRQYFQNFTINNYITKQIAQMYQINQSNQFNLRMTMPSISTRHSLKNLCDEQQIIQKSHADINLNSTNSIESNSNSFFVRISKQSLQEQKRIYRWRMDCNEQFVGISSLKLQSQGNCYNPNLLYKVQLPISKSNFMQVKDLCLTKCVNILKSVLHSVQILLQYFEPIVFTEKMIYITQEGTIKVWMDERYYINPSNQLYEKNKRKITNQQSLRSVTDIFKQKCLKTKISQKLFTILEGISSINQSIAVIQNFQSQQKLFSVQGLKHSTSTGTGLTLLNQSCSLQFSTNNIMKKRKGVQKYEKQGKQSKIKNIASHGFLQHKSTAFDLYQSKFSKKDQKITYKSQYEKNPKDQSLLLGNPKTLFQVKSQKPIQSLIFSQLFTSNNSFGKSSGIQRRISQYPQKQKHSQSSRRNNIETKSLLNPQSTKKIEYNDELINSQTNVQAIIQKNGWNSKIVTLFGGRNLKQSFSQGKQINLTMEGFELKKLHTMGKQVRQSILPVEQQFDEC